MGEITKAYERRCREDWFSKYCPSDRSGIDVGAGSDPINHTFRRWDQIFGDGDATYMEGVPDNSFHTVHASHILEHVIEPVVAIQNWYRITAPGGHLIILVPHRDLYEKKTLLPSNWNFDHKSFWLPETEEKPDTRSFKDTILAAIPNADFAEFRVLDEGWQDVGALSHSVGEYSIEAVIKKTSV